MKPTDNQLHTVTLQWHQPAFLILTGLLPNPHHDGNVGAVYVGIQQADRGAIRGQAHRHIYSNRRLAHAALAAGHGNHVSCQSILVRHAASSLKAPCLCAQAGLGRANPPCAPSRCHSEEKPASRRTAVAMTERLPRSQ